MEAKLVNINEKVPPEVWVAIFTFTQQMEHDDFTKYEVEGPLRPMVYILASVCRFWRSIVREEHQLWSLIPAPPTNAWTQGEHSLLSMAALKSKAPVTVVIYISQVSNRGYTSGPQIQHGSWEVDKTAEQATAVFGQKDYNLHVKMKNNDPQYLRRMFYMPFRKAAALIVSAVEPLYLDRPFDLFGYSSPTSITVINDHPVAKYSVTFTKYTTKCLTFRVNRFHPLSSIGAYLIPSLEELYMLHAFRSGFPQLGKGYQLPNLHTLGITPAARTLLAEVEMPKIRTLVIYGPRHAKDNVHVSFGAKADEAYQRLRHVEFREWGEMDRSKPNSGAVSLLWRMIPKLKALKSIGFIDSFIDGTNLVKMVSGFTHDGGDGSLGSLKEMTLNRVSGITRDECDLVAAVVPKLNIYI